MSLVKPVTTKGLICVQSAGILHHRKETRIILIFQAKIFKLRANDDGSMQDYMEMSLSDPRRIAPTIASVAPLPTSELVHVAAHRSRFQLMQSQNASSS